MGPAVLAAVFCLAQTVQVAVAALTDVPNSYWAAQYIEYLNSRNIVTGYPDNTFRPERPVTRAEFAVMLAKSRNLPTTGGGSRFTDVPAGHWAAGAINAVASQGWIAGYPGGRFLPGQNISMAEMYAILAQASNQQMVSEQTADQVLDQFQDQNAVPQWARRAVATVAQTGLHVDELAGQRVYPNIAATRASVATSLAKLLNEQWRDPVQVAGGTDDDDNLGESVNVTGTLQATATPGEWVITTADNKRYFVMEPGNVTQEDWFRVGNQVRLQGRVNTQASNSNRTVVVPQSIAATATQQNRVTVTGMLRPSTANASAWVVETADNKVYRIINPDEIRNDPLFRYGSTVTVTGNARPDVQVPQADGTAMVVSSIQSAQTGNQVSVTGTLQQTVEAGGWVVNAGNQKYVLLGVDPVEDQAWFKPGTEIMVSGNVRSDIPTIYQEGPVLVVNTIQQTPGAATGSQQVSLFYPNYVNILKDPATMLGTPAVRIIEGPNIPTKAVEALLSGPSDFERVRGYFQDEDLQKLDVKQVNVSADGKATVVLEAPANFAFQSNVSAQRLDEQVERTLRQFTGIKEVNVAVQGPNNTVIWTSPQ